MKSLVIGIMVVVSALLPSKASARRGNPVSSVSSPTVICGSRRLSLEKPGSRKTVGLVGLEVQGRHVEQDQRGPVDAGASGQ